MASGVATASVPVSDVDRAAASYGDTLGLEVRSRQGNDWIEVDANRLTIGLNGRETAQAASGGNDLQQFYASPR